MVLDRDSIPPVAIEGKGEAVRARVLGCGSCAEADRRIGLLEKYPAEVVKALRAPLPVDPASMEAQAYLAQRENLKVGALLVAAPPGEIGGRITWVSQDSPAAAEAQKASEEACGDRAVQICEP